MLMVGLNPRDMVAFNSIMDVMRSRSVRIDPEKVKELLKSEHETCFHPNHKSVLDIVQRRFGIKLEVPRVPRKHYIKSGDQALIIELANIKRLTEGEMYTAEQLRKSPIHFRLFTIR